jgi:hypothetical protein
VACFDFGFEASLRDVAVRVGAVTLPVFAALLDVEVDAATAPDGAVDGVDDDPLELHAVTVDATAIIATKRAAIFRMTREASAPKT